MTDFLAAFPSVNANYTNTNVTLSGDWAFETYEGEFVLNPAGGGDPVEETMKGIHVYRRGADGSWKMVYDIWNTNAPPPEM